MSPATLIALAGIIETLIQQTPQAIALWNEIKASLTSGNEPTTAQWQAIAVGLAASHAQVQAG